MALHPLHDSEYGIGIATGQRRDVKSAEICLKGDLMDKEQEAKNTTWGIIAGIGCVALFMFYAVSTGAMSGGSRAGSCRSCRLPGGVTQNFGGSESFSNTNNK